MNTMERHDTAQPFVAINWNKWITTGMAILLFLGAVVGTVWTASSVITDKADKSDIYQMREDLNEVKTDVAVIRSAIERGQKE